MKILVIPDVHLKPWLFDWAENILKAGQADNAVCLMDMPDDWNQEFWVDKYRETFDRAIRLAKDFPETLWCYGNHEISYVWAKLETGYSPYAENVVISKLEELKNSLGDQSQIAFAHRIGRVIFSHGGLSSDYLAFLDESLLSADIDEVLAAVNGASPKYLWRDNSPLWLRPQRKNP